MPAGCVPRRESGLSMITRDAGSAESLARGREAEQAGQRRRGQTGPWFGVWGFGLATRDYWFGWTSFAEIKIRARRMARARHAGSFPPSLPPSLPPLPPPPFLRLPPSLSSLSLPPFLPLLLSRFLLIPPSLPLPLPRPLPLPSFLSLLPVCSTTPLPRSPHSPEE